MSRLKSSNTLKKNSVKGKYHLYTGERLKWFQVILRLESSVFQVILPWVLFCGIYGFLISLLYHFGFNIAFSEKSGVLTNAVLSFNIGFTLLLVFRTNTAHARFWEGRQLWGALVNTVRNLTQGIYIVVKEHFPAGSSRKRGNTSDSSCFYSFNEVTSKGRAFGRAVSVVDVRNTVFQAQRNSSSYTTNCLLD